MIVYNVTVKVESAITDEWLIWLRNEHIPDIINTGCFTHATIFRLLEVDESEGPTFAIQYFAESKSLYNSYIQKHAEEMRKKGTDKWKGKFIAFRSVLQIVD